MSNWRYRLTEAWWVLTGRWSLDRAWQNGFEQGRAGRLARVLEMKEGGRHGNR